MPLGEHLLSSFIGSHQGKIQKVTLGTNPLRLNFNGKEIVISRYNLFQKLKQNHHPRINFAQEKARVQESARNKNNDEQVPDTYRVAKTIMH